MRLANTCFNSTEYSLRPLILRSYSHISLMKSNYSLSRLCFVFIVIIVAQIELFSQNIVGIWSVEEVRVGNKVRTPEARWFEFKADSTQSSGNGWRQHSIGTYYFDEESDTLRVENTNGYKDEYEAFNVRISGNEMTWDRVEDERFVTVTLSRIAEIPTSTADSLFGVWKLETALSDSDTVTSSLDPEGKRYLYFRWDGTYIEQNTNEGRHAGIFRADAHRPRVELVEYKEETRVEWWGYRFENDLLVLNLLDEHPKQTLIYRRIHYFPE